MSKLYNVTVNGVVYEVEVEEIGAGNNTYAAPAAPAPAAAPAPKAAPAPAAAPVEEKPAPAPVKKVVKKPAPKKDEDDFDDLFDMFKKK